MLLKAKWRIQRSGGYKLPMGELVYFLGDIFAAFRALYYARMYSVPWLGEKVPAQLYEPM